MYAPTSLTAWDIEGFGVLVKWLYAMELVL